MPCESRVITNNSKEKTMSNKTSNEETEVVTEIETEESEALFGVVIKATLKKGKATKVVEFVAEFTFDDVEEFVYQQTEANAEEEHKGWKVDDYEWEILDSDEDEE